MRVTSLYICPWSLNDPLCQSQTLAYLYELTEKGYKFALMTFENPRFAADEPRLSKIRRELEAKSIYWYPVRYREGLSLKAKMKSNAEGLLVGLKIFRRHRPRIIHSRSSLTAALAVILAKITNTKFLYDADSLLSEEYADVGHWSRLSKGFKIMRRTENIARRYADRMIVLTEVLKSDIQNSYDLKKEINVIPCCVNTKNFAFNQDARKKRRAELGLTDEKIFVYVGKAGSWYLVEEMFDFFKAARGKIHSAVLLIVTQDEPEKFEQIAAANEIDKNTLRIVSASAQEVKEYLSASDVGLAFIKSLVSKRGSSPVKVAEYLANGLPTVITEDIGDCSRLIKDKRLGSVVKTSSAQDYYKSIEELIELLADEKELRRRCRSAAVKNFSLQKIGAVRYAEIYRQMLTD